MKNGSGLLAHISKKHAGEMLGARHVQQMVHHNKGACELCGTLRARNERTCKQCGKNTNTRTPVVGDVLGKKRKEMEDEARAVAEAEAAAEAARLQEEGAQVIPPEQDPELGRAARPPDPGDTHKCLEQLQQQL